MTDLEHAKAALKQALASGDMPALAKAEKDIIRLQDLKSQDPVFFDPDANVFIAWGEAEGPVRYSG